MKLNKCLFSSQFSSFGVELCHKSIVLQPFMLNMRLLAVTILKCPDFLPEMWKTVAGKRS